MVRSAIPLLVLLFHYLASLTAALTCYSLNGQAANGSLGLIACNTTAQYTTCCMPDEECRPDKLCQDSHGGVYREYCSDPTWDSPNCSPVCPSYVEAGVILTSCQDGSYCCAFNNTQCCENGNGFRLDASGSIIASFVSVSSTSASAHSASTASSAPTTSGPATATHSATGSPTTSATASPTPSASSGLSAGAEAGIGIGVAAGVILAAVLSYFLYRERSKRKALERNAGLSADPAYAPVPMQQEQPLGQLYGEWGGEVEAREPTYELPGSTEQPRETVKPPESR